jgi:prepilin-type N-terminal cleavage/methylation domain-containing protein
VLLASVPQGKTVLNMSCRQHFRGGVNTVRRGFTLLEVALVMLLISLALLLVAGDFTGSGDAGATRLAQGSAENALDASFSARRALGRFSATPAELSQYAPQTTFVAGNIESTGPQMVSVSLPSATTVVVAVFDGKECWIKVRRFGGGGAAEVHATSTAACSAFGAGASALATPPLDRGGSWAKPWRIS